MKTNVKKIISFVLVAMLALLCACTLFACNKDRDKEEAERDAKLRVENVAIVKDKILNAMDENWFGALDNIAVSKLSNAGDYVSADGWADMICEVLRKSALQTGKLTALKNAITSDDGQKLLDDFSGNAELLIPLMRVADFTPTDISNLTYDLLCALVSDSASAIDGMNKRLDEIKNIEGISAGAVANIQANLLNLALIKDNFVPTPQEKSEMLSAFAKAKAPMSEIVEFAYNMSIGSITDNIFNALFSADGALSNITNGEISTVISTLIMNATNLKNALTDTAIANLNDAMGLVISKFDKNVVSSTLYAEIVQYAKYAYMFVDIIPSVCDIMSSAGKVFDTAMIEQLRSVVGADSDENTGRVNGAIIASKILLEVAEDFSANQLVAIVDKVGSQIKGEYKKTLPIIALDVALNLSTWFKDVESTKIVGKHPDIIGESDIDVMLGTVMLSFGLDKAKQAYAGYTNGAENISTLITAVNGCGFSQFDINNPYNPYVAGQVDAWFNYYMVEGVAEAGRQSVAVCNKAINDIKAFISDFYATDSSGKSLIKKISEWQLVSGSLTADVYNEYEKQIFESDIVGIVAIVEILFRQ